MSDYKSCRNCAVIFCYDYRKEKGLDTTLNYADWRCIPCPSCGGILSEVREHNGKRYRHCYACHFEFEEKEYD